MEDIAAYGRALDLGCGIALSMTLKAVIELDVLEIMAAAGPGAWLWPEEIASKIQSSNPDAHEVLDRMLRFLAAHKVVTCEVVVGEDGERKRRYGLGPVCKYLTKDEDGVSVAPLLLKHHTKVLVETWLNLKHAVLDGSIPFVKTHGVTMFEHEDKDPDFSEIFNKAMFNQTIMLMKKMLENYKGFENINVLVDVGGGHGATLGIILSKYPNIKAINFDLPHVVSKAKPIQGVEFVGGDMFESVPTGDAIFMKWILHDWSNEHCVKILKNCWKALPNNGKVIVVELIIPEIPEDADEAKNSLLGDVIMLAYCVGGRERTEKEYRLLANKSGFSGFNIACCLHNFSIMEFCK
ncbi:caffeic acid 3-O-methyltransferase-like [Dioscorea cayenensis subsp. rotundata]|uniref:Caffeic acid 3-O-methyltransferase-like n=1 Tax=Dioscorea cayennensis subsp. rotundata TaxID=55577 RepID=A0AB40CSS3_DIOCR|nr:caffeic acid 3-O-methyltransferase-like [Dioscorea cayenensis subsp. rotundata]